MRNKTYMRGATLFLMVVLLLIIGIGFVEGMPSSSGFGSTSFVTRQTVQPSFQTYYSESAGSGLGSRLGTYFPILDDPTQCQARQDLVLQVSPTGCEPAVVRSDLLAEQNVPVFCQIDSLKLNPLLDIKGIENIRFVDQRGDPNVVGVGFHPANAALRTNNRLLGDPTINNIGYAVVVLRRNEIEKDLPDSVRVDLQANIRYDSGNPLGIGRSTFFLKEVTDEEWAVERDRQSFFNGRYSIRLESTGFASTGRSSSSIQSTREQVELGIYSGDQRINSIFVTRGETSGDIYIPGSYCQAGLQARFEGFEQARTTATLEVVTSNGTERFDTIRGGRFLNDRCRVDSIVPDGTTSGGGSVRVNCEGQRFTLNLERDALTDSQIVEENGQVIAVIGDRERYILSSTGAKFTADSNNDPTIIRSEEFRNGIRSALQEYLRKKESGESGKLFVDKVFGGNADEEFEAAIADYERVADDFPRETDNVQGFYGEQSLAAAIDLSQRYGKQNTEARLLKKFIDLYPSSSLTQGYIRRQQNFGEIDYSQATASVDVSGRFRNIRLVSVNEPSKSASASFAFGRDVFDLDIEKRWDLTDNYDIDTSRTGDNFYVELTRVENERVRLTTNCETINERGRATRLSSVNLEIGESISICGRPLILRDTDSQELARVSLIPKARNTETETNLSIQIGIDKRDIQLTPDKTEKKIEKLEDNIERWESLSSNLGNINSGFQAACFATAGTLTVKNFIGGLNGKALARQQVMRDKYKPLCKQEVALQVHSGMDACFSHYSDQIKQDVDATAAALAQTDEVIDQIQKDPNNINGKQFLGTNSIHVNRASKDLVRKINAEFSGESVRLPRGRSYGSLDGEYYAEEVPLDQIVNEQNVEDGTITYTQLRDIHTSLVAKKRGGFSDVYTGVSDIDRLKSENRGLTDSQIITGVDSRLSDLALQISNNNEDRRLVNLDKKNEEFGFPPSFLSSGSQSLAVVSSVKGIKDSSLRNELGDEGRFVVKTFAQDGISGIGDRQVRFPAGSYALKLDDRGRVIKAVRYDPSTGELATGPDAASFDDISGRETGETIGSFVGAFNVGSIKPADQDSYFNTILNPEVKYYENQPYRGMPAIVPFNIQEGWYAGTKQTLPAFGGAGPFDASGRVSSFYLCNVGRNGLIDFEDYGFGDDSCQLMDLNSGQTLDVFPGLDPARVRRLVAQAQSAIREAASKYELGGGTVNINGVNIVRGSPAVSVPEASCQDFMSPGECSLLFNVCDPVICPSSRCDFGGKYPVSDVIQSGIVGSALLCLPNFGNPTEGGVAVPVCLSGVKAGIDGYVSVLQAHQQCLQENLETGRLTGICDQIASVYGCEFFWRQAAPLSKFAIPKAFQFFKGEGTRGGAEYLNVQGAWQNARGSADFFTNSYGVNTFKAFRLRSIEEAGGQFCKAFISSNIPTDVDSLLTPPSPAQYHGYFSQTRFTDSTVPPTAQYKVFYHIFSGEDFGASYRVFLKNPPEGGYYSANPILVVESGFIGRGETVSESKDFTAPEGYTELCIDVNGDTECGFKQVSTSFAVNYLRDGILSREIGKEDIRTETQCVSGSPNLAAILNPSLDGAASELVDPALHRRGITRICGTHNPGLQTDPTRFVEVGVCGNEEVKCWLDKRSVDDAITDNNVGVKAQTLEELEQKQFENLQGREEVLNSQDADAELNALAGEVRLFEDDLSRGVIKDYDFEVESANSERLIGNLDQIRGKLFFNHHKALGLWLKARINGALADASLRSNDLSEKEEAERERMESDELGGGILVLGSNVYDPTEFLELTFGVEYPDEDLVLVPSFFLTSEERRPGVFEVSLYYSGIDEPIGGVEEDGEIYVYSGTSLSEDELVFSSDNADFTDFRALSAKDFAEFLDGARITKVKTKEGHVFVDAGLTESELVPATAVEEQEGLIESELVFEGGVLALNFRGEYNPENLVGDKVTFAVEYPDDVAFIDSFYLTFEEAQSGGFTIDLHYIGRDRPVGFVSSDGLILVRSSDLSEDELVFAGEFRSLSAKDFAELLNGARITDLNTERLRPFVDIDSDSLLGEEGVVEDLGTVRVVARDVFGVIDGINSLEDLGNREDVTSVRIIGVNVGDEELREIVPRLLNLKNLRSLDLTGTGITSLEPVAALEGLVSLHFSGTDVSSMVPLRSLNLKDISFSDTKVTSLESLWSLNELEQIDLSGAPIESLEPLQLLENVIALHISGSKVRDLEPLRGLVKLRDFSARDMEIKSLEPLRHWDELEFLSLDGSRICEDEAEAREIFKKMRDRGHEPDIIELKFGGCVGEGSDSAERIIGGPGLDLNFATGPPHGFWDEPEVIAPGFNSSYIRQVSDFNEAAHFGEGRHLRVSDPLSLNKGEHAISVWVNPESISGRRIIYSESSNRFGPEAPVFLVGFEDGEMYYRILNFETAVWEDLISSSERVVAGKWQHLAFVKDSSGMKFYLNGELVGSNPEGNYITPGVHSSASAEIGRSVDDREFLIYYEGFMDDFLAYNQALSEDQIRDIFESGIRQWPEVHDEIIGGGATEDLDYTNILFEINPRGFSRENRKNGFVYANSEGWITTEGRDVGVAPELLPLLEGENFEKGTELMVRYIIDRWDTTEKDERFDRKTKIVTDRVVFESLEDREHFLVTDSFGDEKSFTYYIDAGWIWVGDSGSDFLDNVVSNDLESLTEREGIAVLFSVSDRELYDALVGN